MLTKRRPFEISHSSAFKPHLLLIDKKHHRLILETIEEQLLYEPNVETKNRKPLEGPVSYGQDVWELRFGPQNCFRVFYDFQLDQRSVYIHDIGIKIGNRLQIGGKAFHLETGQEIEE